MTSADDHCCAATGLVAAQTSMVVASSELVAKSVFIEPSPEQAFDGIGSAFGRLGIGRHDAHSRPSRQTSIVTVSVPVVSFAPQRPAEPSGRNS
jgi:hypothetical protein